MRLFVFLALFFVVSTTLVIAINTPQAGYRITTTAQTINVHGDCRIVSHDTGRSNIFAPTRTLDEWNAFKIHRPTWVSVLACGCVDSTWTPNTSTICSGISFTQISNCGNERTMSGTKSCQDGSSYSIGGMLVTIRIIDNQIYINNMPAEMWQSMELVRQLRKQQMQ